MRRRAVRGGMTHRPKPNIVSDPTSTIAMNQASPAVRSKAKKSVPAGWFIGAAILLLLFPILRWFDNTTELIPNHDDVLNGCMAFAGLSVALCVGLCIRDSKGMTAVRRVLAALLVSLFVFVTVFAESAAAAAIVEGLIDFPSDNTTSYNSLLSISRAYRTHGRTPSWNMQTTPIWADFNITSEDYEFMLAHRRPGDPGRNPDRISSQGYFCAQVTMERAGSALRVMHAGTHTLPKGTVIVCPSGSGR